MSEVSTDDPYLSLTTVAKMFDVKVTTVRKWCRDGKLESHILPSGHRRVLTSEVRRFANVKYGA